jgi:16S rRNA (guanine1207-N2)-methyltransferase
VNVLAVAAARENLMRQALVGESLAGDALDPVFKRRYDLMLSNPPFHSGKQVTPEITERFIQHGRDLLVPGGQFVLVANRFLRYDRVLDDVFGGHTILADNRQYWVLMADR